MQFSTEFGDRLAGLRRSTGMTQDALASRLGVSAQAVSKWERAVCLSRHFSFARSCGHLRHKYRPPVRQVGISRKNSAAPLELRCFLFTYHTHECCRDAAALYLL